jgi:hypothetical protein
MNPKDECETCKERSNKKKRAVCDVNESLLMKTPQDACLVKLCIDRVVVTLLLS